ncbi:hypothetical protein, partial [uncultured Parabacteroides sp.]
DTEILNRGISIAIPDEASHIRSIRLTTSLSHFIYYYPEKGYQIAQGIHLPPFRAPAVGDIYANGVVIQAGVDSSGQHIEPDIIPYKGSVMEIREQTLDYFDALIYCESISEGTLDNWHLPDMLNLVLLHTRQREFNLLLAKRQGTLLYDEEYWCKDNSVIDLGIAFNMANSSLDICPKKEKRQVRAILDY